MFEYAFLRFHARNVYSYTCIRFIEGELVLANSMTSTVHDLDPQFAKALEKQKKIRVNNQGKILVCVWIIYELAFLRDL